MVIKSFRVWSLAFSVLASLREIIGSSLRGSVFHRPKQSPAKILLFVFLTLISLSANAKILLPQILGNDMVLQRDKPLNIWGFGNAGEMVTVSFASQTKTTITNADGKWAVVLSPLKTSSTPQKMTITGDNKIVLNNILIGEVWLCSGQSNMEYAMRKLEKIPTPKNASLGFPKDEVAKAKNNQIRIFLVNRKELIKPDSIHQTWAMVNEQELRNFSVVGYFFAKELQEKLGIPIGVISSAVPGSAIEPWISNEAFANEPFFKSQKVGNDPSKFYTPMVEPLTKFSIRGVLWYQGETNCFLGETISYAYKMKALINSWRKAWKDEKMPFYYVQIAPYEYSKTKGKVEMTADTEPNFWEAQAQLLRLPNTGMVVTTDLNDNQEDLHPTYKWEVGRRLSLFALAKTYNEQIDYSGPIYIKHKIFGRYFKLSFDHLDFFGSKVRDQFKGFEVAGKDGIFKSAEAFQKGDEIILSSSQVPHPKYARYNWTENPTGNFYSNGLPAMPFRTHNSLTKQFKIN